MTVLHKMYWSFYINVLSQGMESECLFRGQIEMPLEYRNKSRGALMFLRASVSVSFLESILKAAVQCNVTSGPKMLLFNR